MGFLMIGTQRSGSNLLRLMLNQVPGIAAPHPPHILQRLMPLVSNYGNIEQKETFQLLVDDVNSIYFKTELVSPPRPTGNASFSPLSAAFFSSDFLCCVRHLGRNLGGKTMVL